MPGRRTRPQLHRTCKRQKLNEQGTDVEATPLTPVPYDKVPPTVWAKALDFLTMDDVLNCSITSKFFLKEVSPLIRYLLVRNKHNLQGTEARKRFGGVTNIFVFSLIEPTEDDANRRPRFDFLTCSNLVPFLTSFPKLKFAFCGGLGTKPPVKFKLVEGVVSGMPVPSWCPNYPQALFQAVATYFSWNIENPFASISSALADYIRRLCQAYATGQLKKQVRMFTLPQQRQPGTNKPRATCMFSRKDKDGNKFCPICPLVCKSFPPAQVLRCWHYEIPCLTVEERLELMWDSHHQEQQKTLANNNISNGPVLQQGEDLRPLFHRHLLEELRNSKVEAVVKRTATANTNEDNTSDAAVEEEEVVMTYFEEKLRLMTWLIEKGANPHDPKILYLLTQHGDEGFGKDGKGKILPRRLDRQVFEKLREWGVAVQASDFRVIDLPRAILVTDP